MSLLNLTIIVGYFLILLIIGAAASRKIKSTEDFMIGGRNVSFWVFVLLVISSCASGMSLLGTAGLGFVTGWPTIWEQVLVPLTTALCILLYGTKIYRVSLTRNYMTIQDYFSHRYDSPRAMRALSAFVVITVSTIYLAGQYTAISIVLSWLFKIPHSLSLLLGAVIVMLYVIMGGLYAVAWTALFQGIIIIGGVLLVCPFIIAKAGGLTHINTVLGSIDPNFLHVAFPQMHPPYAKYAFATPAFLASFGLLLGLGLGSAPHIINNILTAKRLRYYKWAPLAAFVIYLVVMYLIKLTGFATRSLVQEGLLVLPHAVNAQDFSFVAAVQYVMPNYAWPLFVMMVLSAVLTTTDRLMLTIGSSFSWDIYKSLFHPSVSDRALNWLNRIVIIVVALGTMFLAVKPPELLAWIIWMGIGIMLDTFVAPLLFGLYWRRTTREGGFYGMLAGLISAVGFGYYHQFVKPLPMHFSFYGFVISVAVTVLVSLATPKTSEQILDETDTGMYISKKIPA